MRRGGKPRDRGDLLRLSVQIAPQRCANLLQGRKGDYGSGFTTALRGIEPLIRHEHGVANNPNSQALAEGAVGIARGVLRRMYKAYDSSDWPTMLPEANSIMNNRKNAALDYVSPSDLLDAFQDNDTAIINKALGSLRKRAGKRRGPGGTVDDALQTGTRVRLANLAYMKSAGMRGNTLKSIPRGLREWTGLTEFLTLHFTSTWLSDRKLRRRERIHQTIFSSWILTLSLHIQSHASPSSSLSLGGLGHIIGLMLSGAVLWPAQGFSTISSTHI